MYDVNHYFSMLIHGNAGKSDEGAASYVESILTFIENFIANGFEAIPLSVMPGFSQLPNIHPLLVHFPIALLSIFFLLDCFGSIFKLISWRRAASWFLYLGAISALLTVGAGFQAAGSVPHNNIVHEILYQHQILGITVASLALFLSIWRLLAKGLVVSFANLIYQLLSLTLVLTIIMGADLGGLMVYKHGVGTVTSAAATSPHDHSH
jgi:uncharacterized membrane protein